MFEDLSDRERVEFLKKLKDHEKRKSSEVKHQRSMELLQDRDFLENNFANEKLIRNRERLLESFQFEKDDMDVIRILEQSDRPNKEYFLMFYILTTFDHHFFVEKRLTFDMSVEGKFFYVLGASMSEEVEEDSKNSALYKICTKVYDWMLKCHQTEYQHMELLNHYLAIIGMLIIGVPYEKVLLENNFVMGFNPGKTGKRYCVLIPSSEQDNPLLKELHDFYYKNIGKGFFEGAVIMPNNKKLLLDKEHYDAFKDSSRNIQPSNNLNGKLASLRRGTAG